MPQLVPRKPEKRRPGAAQNKQKPPRSAQIRASLRDLSFVTMDSLLFLVRVYQERDLHIKSFAFLTCLRGQRASYAASPWIQLVKMA